MEDIPVGEYAKDLYKNMSIMNIKGELRKRGVGNLDLFYRSKKELAEMLAYKRLEEYRRNCDE